jgi:OFA family oxalate/formate antiporter-like MFS transporter
MTLEDSMEQEGRLGHRSAITLIACVGLSTSVVPVFAAGTAVLLTAISKESGWTRGEVSSLIAAGLIGIAIGAPLVGRLIGTYGARRIVLSATIAFPLSLLLFSSSGTLGMASALAFIVGMVGSGVSQYSYLPVLPFYFDRRLGLSLGIAMFGMGLGTILVPIGVEQLQIHCSWREVFRVLAFVVFGISFPSAFFLLRMPSSSLPSRHKNSTPKPPVGGMTAAAAIGSRVFVQLALCIFLSIAAMTGFAIHLTALLTDRGFSPRAAALTFSLWGLTQALARLTGGWLLDLVDGRWIGAIFLSAAAAGAAALAIGSASYIVLLSICLLASATGMDGDLLPYLVRRYFGLRAYSTIYGALGFAFSFGPPVGTFVLGRGFDRFGGYTQMMLLVACSLVISVLLIVSLGKPKAGWATL